MSAAELTHLEAALAQLAHAAVLGVLVLIGLWVLRGRLEARWRIGLWLVVLALPITPTAPWSLF